MSFEIQERGVWRRKRDGATAIIVSVARRVVYFRREQGGELMRIGLDLFRETYEVAHG